MQNTPEAIKRIAESQARFHFENWKALHTEVSQLEERHGEATELDAGHLDRLIRLNTAYYGISEANSFVNTVKSSPLVLQVTSSPADRSKGITYTLNRGMHFFKCLICGKRFSLPIPDQAEPEYRHNPRNPLDGLCSGCVGHHRATTVKLVQSEATVKVLPEDKTPTDYARLTDDWQFYYKVASKYAQKVEYDDRPDVTHNIIIELYQAQKRNGEPLAELTAYRIASYCVADYWRERNLRQTSVCIVSGYPVKPNHKTCKFRHKPERCRDCGYLASRPVQSLEAEMENEQGETVSLVEAVADDTALDLPAWLDAKNFLLGCPYRLFEIAGKRKANLNLNTADRKYLWKWRKKAQKSLF